MTPPHVCYKRLRVRARVARLAEKAVKVAAKAEDKAKAKAAKVEATAKAKAWDKTKKQEEKNDLLATAKRMRERSKANSAARIAI